MPAWQGSSTFPTGAVCALFFGSALRVPSPPSPPSSFTSLADACVPAARCPTTRCPPVLSRPLTLYSQLSSTSEESPPERYHHSADAYRGSDGSDIVYIFGGQLASSVKLRDLWRGEVDVARGKVVWSQMAEPPVSLRASTRHASVLAPDGGALYIHGGHTGLGDATSLHRYDTRLGVWAELEDSRRARSDHSLLAWGERLYAVMGADGATDLAIESTSLRGGSWREVATGEEPAEAAAGVHGLPPMLYEAGAAIGSNGPAGTIVIFGGLSHVLGSDTHIEQSDALWAFQLGGRSDEWATGTGAVPTARVDSAMVAMDAALVMQGGGTYFQTAGEINDAGLLPRDDVWVWWNNVWHVAEASGGEGVDSRLGHSMVHAGGAKLLVYGGVNPSGMLLRDVWALTMDLPFEQGGGNSGVTPAKATWEEIDSRQTTPLLGRDEHTAVVLWDTLDDERAAESLAQPEGGRMFVFGGWQNWAYGSDQAPTSELISFDLQDKCWREHGGGRVNSGATPIGDLWPSPRSRHACTASGLRMFCFGGGMVSGGPSPTQATMDAMGDLWAYTPPPPPERSGDCFDRSADPGEWSLLAPAADAAPHGRFDHSLVAVRRAGADGDQSEAALVVFGGTARRVVGAAQTADAAVVEFDDVWYGVVDLGAALVAWRQVFPAEGSPVAGGPNAHASAYFGGVISAFGGVHSADTGGKDDSAPSSNVVATLDLNACADVCGPLGCANRANPLPAAQRACLSPAFNGGVDVALADGWTPLRAPTSQPEVLRSRVRLYDANGNLVAHDPPLEVAGAGGLPGWEVRSLGLRVATEDLVVEVVHLGVTAMRAAVSVSDGANPALLVVPPPLVATLRVVAMYRSGETAPAARVALRSWDASSGRFVDALPYVTADAGGEAIFVLPGGDFARDNELYEAVATTFDFAGLAQLEARATVEPADMAAGGTSTVNLLMPLDPSAPSPPPPPVWAPGASGSGPGAAVVTVELPSPNDLAFRFALRMVAHLSDEYNALMASRFGVPVPPGPAFKAQLVPERVAYNGDEGDGCGREGSYECLQSGLITQVFTGLRADFYVAVLHQCLDEACEQLSLPIAFSERDRVTGEGEAASLRIRTMRMQLASRLVFPRAASQDAGLHGGGLGGLNVTISSWGTVADKSTAASGGALPGREHGVARLVTDEDGWFTCDASFDEFPYDRPVYGREPCMLWSTAEYYVEASANVGTDDDPEAWENMRVISPVHVESKERELASWYPSPSARSPVVPLLPFSGQPGGGGESCAAGTAGRSWLTEGVYCAVAVKDFCASASALQEAAAPTAVPERFSPGMSLYRADAVCLWEIRPDPRAMQITVRMIESGLAPGDTVTVAATPDCDSSACGALALDGRGYSRTVGVRGAVAYVLLHAGAARGASNGGVPVRLGRGFQFEYVSLDDHRVITLHMTWTMLGTFLLTGTCCLLAGLWKRYVHPRLVRLRGGEAAMLEMQRQQALVAAAQRPARAGLDERLRRQLTRLTYSKRVVPGQAESGAAGASAEGGDSEGKGNVAPSVPSLDGAGDGDDEGGLNTTCSICLCDFEDGDTLVELTCGHRFHDECVNQWLTRDVCCPNCRLDMREPLAAAADAHAAANANAQALLHEAAPAPAEGGERLSPRSIGELPPNVARATSGGSTGSLDRRPLPPLRRPSPPERAGRPAAHQRAPDVAVDIESATSLPGATSL